MKSMIRLFFVISLIVSMTAVSAVCISTAHAVTPPTVKERQKAERHHDSVKKEKRAEQRASGCAYGRDEITGKCYEPKEGQFYRDPATGDVKVKKVEKWNLPWD